MKTPSWIEEICIWVVVYVYIFNREREREIVRRRQSSIVSIIFSFFEIIRSLSLSFFFAFCCCRESEAPPFQKKKNLRWCEKKSPEILSAFSSCFVTNFRSPSPIQLLERRRRRISRVQKKNSLFLCSKTTKETFIFHFQTVFWNGIRGKTRKTRAREKW